MKKATLFRNTKTATLISTLFLGLTLIAPHYALAALTADTYPTSIAGCQLVSNPGSTFTCDLKDSTQDEYYDPWMEENRECTSYAAWMLSSVNGFTMPFHADAVNWGTIAAGAPYYYTVNSTPAVGSIYWSSSSDHVAWVESVSLNGSSVTLEDYNQALTGHFNEYSVSTSSASGYIHFKDLGSNPAALQYTSSEMDVFKTTNSLGSNGTPYRDTWTGTWSGWNSLGGTLAGGMTAIKYNSEMDVFGVATNGQVVRNYSLNGSTWSGWSSLSTTVTTSDRSVAAVQFGSEMDVYMRGTDNNIYKDTTFNGSTWGGFGSLGGGAASVPAAVAYGAEMDVFMRGTDNAIWKDTWNGHTWGGFSSMLGTLIGKPTAIQYNSELDVFATSSNGQVVRDYWNGSTWSNWNSLGGTSGSSPAAIQYTSSEMDVYARMGQNIYKDTTFNGSTWGGFGSSPGLGGNEVSDPIAVTFGSPEMDVYATNSGFGTDKDTWNGSTWGGFSQLN